MAGYASYCASRSQSSPMLTIEKSQKNREVPNFQKVTLSGVRTYHVGLTVATFFVAHVGVLGSLSHPCPFVHGTMWASFLSARDCGVLSIVLCVLRGLEPSLLLFLAISSQVSQRPHYYLSRCCLGSYHRLSDCLHAHLLDGAFRLLLHLSYNIT